MKEKLEAYLNSYLKPKKEKSFFREKRSCAPQIEEDYCCEESAFVGMAMSSARSASIQDFINENKEEDTFQTLLFKYIDNKNLKDSDVYNKVNMDRRLFSKIRSNVDYHPTKETIILLGIALELTESELEELLEKASYSLPKNQVFDLIIRFCFKEKIYDLNQINEFLFDHKCKTLSE